MKYIFRLLSLLAVIAGFTPAAEAASDKKPAPKVMTAPYPFSRLSDDLIKKNPSSIAEALDILPQQFRDHFTLVHASKSLQGATTSDPRAVLFGETAHLILTFNGRPDQDGYFELETAEYDPLKKRIYFRQIFFKKEWGSAKGTTLPAKLSDQFLENELKLTREDVEKETASVLITRPNPAKCLQCHAVFPEKFVDELDKPHDQRTARYLWHAYNAWPGAFGAIDDDASPPGSTSLRNSPASESIVRVIRAMAAF